MSSVNKVILVCNLGRDPEIRNTQAGEPIANLSVATNESWKDRQTGERRERVEWHRVVIFGKLAEVARDYLHKGSKVYFEGELRTRKWSDQSGQDRYSTEIVLTGYGGRLVMLDPPKAADATKPAAEPGGYGSHRGGSAPAATASPAPDLDDEIPF